MENEYEGDYKNEVEESNSLFNNGKVTKSKVKKLEQIYK